MALKIVLEGDLTLCVLEFVSIVDLELKTTPETREKAQKALDSDNKDEIRSIVLESAGLFLTSFNALAFEPTFNLLLQILNLLNKEDQAALNKDLLAVLTNGFTVKETKIPTSSIITAITNAFNLMSEDFIGRFNALDLITDLVLESFPTSISSIASGLNAWLAPISELTATQKNELVTKVFLGYFEQDESAAFEFVKEITSPESTTNDEIIVELLNAKNYYDLTSFKTSEKLNSLVSIYTSFDYTKFQESKLTIESVNMTKLGEKLLNLSLINFFAQSKESVFTYKQLSSVVSVEETEIESIIFPLVSQGIITGKFSQLNKTFTVNKVSPLVSSRTEIDWKDIDSQLSQWLDNLTGLDAQVGELITNSHKKKKVPAVIQRFHLAKQESKKELEVEEV